MSGLHAILRENMVNEMGGSSFHSHVSMRHPKGKFSLKRVNLENLLDELEKSILDPEYGKKGDFLGVAEKPPAYMPVVVDVDIKVEDFGNLSDMEHLYTDDQVREVIGIYQTVLTEIIEDPTPENLTCVLLEKPIYYINGKDETVWAKNGFHLHFPNCILSKANQETHLIPRVQQKLDEYDTFCNLLRDGQKSSDMIDKGAMKNPWLMYGCCKDSDENTRHRPYLVTKVYNEQCKEVSAKTAFRSYTFRDNKNRIIRVGDNVEKHWPRILSIIGHGKTIEEKEVKPDLICLAKENFFNKAKKKDNKKNNSVSVEENVNIARELMPLIADWRAEDYEQWIHIGWCLHNVSEGSQDGYDLWSEFSMRCSEKFDEVACIDQWKGMVNKNSYTIGSLFFYAKKDSPERYAELQKEKANTHLHKAIECTHTDMAKALHAMYRNDFALSVFEGKGGWYQFKGHFWEEIPEGIYLRKKISSELPELFAELAKEIGAQSIQAKLEGDGDKAVMLQKKSEKFKKCISKCNDSGFKDRVMKECREVFFNPEFKKKLDQNKYLVGFQNGVYDLNINILRNGRPDDYISKHLPIPYIEYNLTDSSVQEMLGILAKLFPDEELRKYVLDTYSDVFVGGNTWKQCYMWTGSGDNGKSVFQNLFNVMLGDLARKAGTQLVTGKKTALGAPNPELARARPPVRFLSCEEPDGDEQVQMSILKMITGGDQIIVRDLYQGGSEMSEFIATFMFNFVCNKLPNLKYSDQAIWNRMVVIPFEATFKDDPPVTIEEQIQQKIFPIDRSLTDKLPDISIVFAWYLLEHRKSVSGRPHMPEKVKAATKKYQQQNDIYKQFINEFIIEDSNGKIETQDLYNRFKVWHKENFPYHNLANKNEVVDHYDHVWGSQKSQKWSGVRFLTEEEQIDAGDIIVMSPEDFADTNTSIENGHGAPF